MNSAWKSVVEQAILNAGCSPDIRSLHTVSDGGGQAVLRVSLCSRRELFAKIVQRDSSDRLASEFVGLKAIGDVGILAVPEVLPVYVGEQQTVLLIEALAVVQSEVIPQSVWERFGQELAAHHEVTQGNRYGWDSSNFIGSTQQHNNWCTDWVEFNRINRLGFQLTLARERGLLSERDTKLIEQVIDQLKELIPKAPPASLIHGDLWAGNALPALVNGDLRIAVIDPAVSIGDGWADIAMMKLFGGFPDVVYDAYRSARHDCEFQEKRILVYQLYHWLNHLNIFGHEYLDAVVSCARACLGLKAHGGT